MEDSTNGMKLEEKEKLLKLLCKKGWRLTTEGEYLVFYFQKIQNAETKEEKESLQKQMFDILHEADLATCFMVPVDFNNKEEE